MKSRRDSRQELLQARTLLDSGQLTRARAVYERICRFVDTGNSEAWLSLGTVNAALGAVDEAIGAIRKAIHLQPDCPDAWLALGRAQQQQGYSDQAEQSYLKAVELAPDNAAAHTALAFIQAACGKDADSVIHFDEALALQPDNIELLISLAGVCQKMANHARGDTLLKRVLQLQPGDPRALTGLGFSAVARGDYPQASGLFQRVLDRDCGRAEAHYGMGVCLAQMGRSAQALDSLRETVRLVPGHMAAWKAVINLMLMTGKPEEVLRACNQALDVQPGNPDILAISARVLARTGRKAQAVERLQPVLELGGVNVNVGLAFAALADYLGQQKTAIECLEQLLQTGRVTDTPMRRRVLFALGRLCDARGSYDKAFGYYREANNLVIDSGYRESIIRRCRRGQARLESLMQVHSAGLHAGLAHATNTSQLPVFIVGMPRSGTTLVEQILASHPEVHGAGELNWLANLADAIPARAGCPDPYPHCASSLPVKLLDNLSREYLGRLEGLAAGATRVTDKMPGNYLLLGLVDLLFPGARIIHCVRNPLDTCLSIYFQEFQKGETYSGELTDVGRIYLQYRQLMLHWQKLLSVPILNIRYEELVLDQEKVSRDMVDFCGLPWDDRCLRFYENERYIHTASYDQVNKPVYRDSLDRWKNYTAWLGPLRKLLGSDDWAW